MKEKDQKYYHKLVFTGNWKKVDKAMAECGLKEKEWMLEALGVAASKKDEAYNKLVMILQSTTDKGTQLAAVAAMGSSGRSAASSQLEFVAARTEDPQVLEAVREARHHLKTTAK